MSETTEIAAITPSASDVPMLPIAKVMERLHGIQELAKAAMVEGVDFGKIPGTGSKPTLLKPGAEKLGVLFQLDCQWDTRKTFDGLHMIVETYCTIYHAPTGNRLGGASAMASTREAKYAYRGGARLCPECKKPAIIKGKAEFGGGWLCWAKKDGCGAKFADDDPAITGQSIDRIENPDIADTYNTVVRMAEKRAHVAAIRLVTGASSIFDEDADVGDASYDSPPPKQEQKPATKWKKPPATTWQEEAEALRKKVLPALEEAADNGYAAYGEAWAKLTMLERNACATDHPALKKRAQDIDAIN